ncbi:MAG: energy-coupling factor ABC transporter ATP-binding protein, partial [Lachnospiraceae bacterium]|nr:energy-coupling factor ABC transporter ATP-binding protein [Lachnospiraceae bacterium]
MIQITDASFGYDKEHKIISNLTLSIAEGERVGLIGANGAGKSTLLKMLTGLVGHEGSIRICGLEVEKKNLPEIRKSLGFVFQDSDSQLFMPTVYDDIAFAPRNYGMSKEEVEDRVNEALERTGIAYLKYKENYKMSGGEKRMACIATILAMKPKIILMDEPSIALDPFNRRTLINNLNQLPETKLIASHDLDMILDTCD